MNKETTNVSKILGIYHLACMNDYMDIFCEQFDLLHSSGLYTAFDKLLIYISMYDNNPILNNKLKEYDPDNKFLIFKSEANLKEKFAIDDFRNHIEDESYMFYFHSKRVSTKPGDKKYFQKEEWRKILNFYTISKWKISLELLKQYDAVGGFLTRWPEHHFSGNFWWARADYITNLPDCRNHYLAPEMWLGANFNNNFVSLTNDDKFSSDIHLTRADEDIFKNVTCSIINNKGFKPSSYYKKYYLKMKKLLNSKKGYTDKDTTHSYLPLYEKLLNPIHDKARNVLEIGIGDFKENGVTDIKNGGSIWLWLDFFEKAHIYSIDILSKESVMDELHDEERFSFFGDSDAYDSNFVKNNFVDKNIKFDFILDDGPHTLKSMISCIKLYHNLLTETGIMIIEDVQVINWFNHLKNATPDHLKKYIKTYDLRENKGRFDDLVFTIDKLNI